MELIRCRRAISTLLALLLAVESVAAVSVAAASSLAPRPASHALPAASPAGEVLAETGTASRSWEPTADSATGASAATPDTRDYAVPTAASTATPVAKTAVKHPIATKPTKVARPTTKTKAPATTTTRPKAATYAGRNHVWIPSLGVSQSVASFACNRAAPPANFVYRWGCAGSNNTYLLGHAYGVFKPLHDAYLNGRLVAGMKVYFADGSGATHVYAVRWWKLAKPTTDASWAWAPQAVPSMTLQTCMGANSEYRLFVRLVEVS